MTGLSSYSTGTVTVSAGGTTVTGIGTIWSGTNARPGDMLQIGNFQTIISDVVDTDTLTIPPWGGGAQTSVAYAIWQWHPQRVAGAQTMQTVDQLVAAINTTGFFVFVAAALTEPDPSLGNEGQYAFQPTTGKTWVKSAGVWTYLGIYKAFQLKGAWSGATDYSVGDVVALSGSSYVCILDHTNHTPPNATYWQVLAERGTDGDDGAAATVAVGSVTTGAGGSAADVTNSGTSSAAVLDFTIPAGKTYGGTSTTSLTIGTGSKAFTAQSGLAYTNGARVRATATAGATGWLEGVATYSGTTLTITSDKTSGSGTGTAWNFNVVGEPGAGDLSSANNLSELTDKSAARNNLGVPQSYGQCRLTKSGSNLVLSPFNGNLLTVNGVPCTVPDGGVSLAATGLTPGTTYMIYATASGGVVNALEASTAAHATSTTSGNKGTEIKSGDDTRTLVGVARVITGPAWVDTAAQRFVRSWFNRNRVSVAGANDTASTETSISTYVEKTVSKAEFVCFADDATLAGAYGMMTNTSQNWTGLQVYLDGVAVGVGLDINIVSAASRATYNPLWPTNVAADGYHYVTFGMATVGGGTVSVASYHGMAAIATVG